MSTTIRQALRAALADRDLLAERVEELEEAMEAIEMETRKPNGVITNEWYHDATHRAYRIARAAVPGEDGETKT